MMQASGSKTPVAVVRGQPHDRTIEKATSYIAIFTSAFNGDVSKQEEFLKLLQEFAEGKYVSYLTNFSLYVLFLQPGSVSIMKNLNSTCYSSVR